MTKQEEQTEISHTHYGLYSVVEMWEPDELNDGRGRLKILYEDDYPIDDLIEKCVELDLTDTIYSHFLETLPQYYQDEIEDVKNAIPKFVIGKLFDKGITQENLDRIVLHSYTKAFAYQYEREFWEWLENTLNGYIADAVSELEIFEMFKTVDWNVKIDQFGDSEITFIIEFYPIEFCNKFYKGDYQHFASPRGDPYFIDMKYSTHYSMQEILDDININLDDIVEFVKKMIDISEFNYYGTRPFGKPTKTEIMKLLMDEIESIAIELGVK